MNKRNKKLLLLGLIVMQIISYEDNKHVIGCRSHVGFFSNFLAVIHQLQWAERNRKVPVVYWPAGSLYHDERGLNGVISDNVWDYYFSPVSQGSYCQGDQVYYEYSMDGYAVATLPFPLPYQGYEHIIQLYPNQPLRQAMHGYIDRYIKIKEPIAYKIEQFYQQHLKDKFTVSIHLRGTDKHYEIGKVAYDQLFEEANKFAPCQFYVATDEKRLLEEAHQKLNGPVVSYECFRADGKYSSGIHYLSGYPADRSRALLGEEALIECVLLSRCNVMVHTWSNLSISALLFNPDLEHIHVAKGI